jgi:hypothetical protein
MVKAVSQSEWTGIETGSTYIDVAGLQTSFRSSRQSPVLAHNRAGGCSVALAFCPQKS